MRRSPGHIEASLLQCCVALILACNYFAFQVELFDAEYEENHPAPVTSSAVSSPTLTWESFDKDGALEAFVLNACLRIECVVILPLPPPAPPVAAPPSTLVRDKSPPLVDASL